MRILISALAIAALCLPLSAQCVPAPATENFDAGLVLPMGWADGGGVNMWTVDANGTPSLATGPSGDNTTGTTNYVFCETSAPTAQGETYILNTPCYDTSALANPTLGFYLHAFGATIGGLSVEQDDGAGGWTVLFTQMGDQGDAWNLVEVPFTPLAGNTASFRFVYTRGSSFTGDLAIDDVTIGEPSPVEWETNDAESSFDFDGATVTNVFAGPGAISTVCANSNTTVNIASTNVGLPWDIAVNVGTANVPGTTTGIVTPNGQILNQLVLPTTVFLNNLNLTTPFLGSFSAPIAASSFGTLTSAQQFNISPTNPDNVALSQSCQIETFTTTLPTFPIAGPTSDDGSVIIDLGCDTATFYGTSFSTIAVNSNGRFIFGADNNGFQATAAFAMTDAPFCGVWGDYSPNSGGFVTIINPAPNIIQADWVGVPYYQELTTANSFSVSLDISNGTVVLTALGGLAVNPVTSGTPSGSDNTFLGLSLGNLGATDAGPTDYTLLSGAPAASTDMIYEDGLLGALPNSIANGITQITYLPAGASYAWTSF